MHIRMDTSKNETNSEQSLIIEIITLWIVTLRVPLRNETIR